MEYGSWLRWQIDYLLFLQNFRDISHHIFDQFFICITTCGEVIIPISIICTVYWAINKRAGQFILFSYTFGFLSNMLAKTTACIYRPWILDCRVHPVPQAIPAATGYSFPSGHTAGATSVWGGLAVYFWNNKLVRYVSIIILLCVMISRNYLGVHTPQDVIVSFSIGLILLYFTNKLIKWEEEKAGRDIAILVSVITICLLTVLYVSLRHYPIHYLFGKILFNPYPLKIDALLKTSCVAGTFTGWLIEKRFINFEVNTTSLWKKIIRVAFGITIIFCMHGAAVPVGFHHIGGAIQSFVIGLFITCLYPLMIKKWNL